MSTYREFELMKLFIQSVMMRAVDMGQVDGKATGPVGSMLPSILEVGKFIGFDSQ